MVTTRPPKTIVKPTALGPVANTDTKLLIYGLFQKGRVLAQDGVNERCAAFLPDSRGLVLSAHGRWTSSMVLSLTRIAHSNYLALPVTNRTQSRAIDVLRPRNLGSIVLGVSE